MIPPSLDAGRPRPTAQRSERASALPSPRQPVPAAPRAARSRRHRRPSRWQWVWKSTVWLAAGCGTTRMTDTQRTATEQLLISNAVDQVVSQIDFRPLANKSVYFDPQYLDMTADRGYVVSSLRQQLLACGCILQEDKTKAAYIVEARSGGIGTDRHSLLIGIPQMTVPTFVPGQPSQIPEIPFAKKTDELGVAKLALFAYNRLTGQRVWQSGTLEAGSSARDLWVVGLGPFRKGTILQGTEFAGEELPLPLLSGPDGPDGRGQNSVLPATSAMTWKETAPPPTHLMPLVKILAHATLADHLPLSVLADPPCTTAHLAVVEKASSPETPSARSSGSPGPGNPAAEKSRPPAGEEPPSVSSGR